VTGLFEFSDNITSVQMQQCEAVLPSMQAVTETCRPVGTCMVDPVGKLAQ